MPVRDAQDGGPLNGVEISFVGGLSLERTDVNFVEEKLLRERERIFQEILLEVFTRIEEEVTKEEPRCGCGKAMEREGRNPRRLVTLLGAVSFKRARYRCKGCGKERYPLDEALGLEAGRKSTLGVRERALRAVVVVSYEKAEEFLRNFYGLEVSRGTIHSMAVEEGRRIEGWIQERPRELFGKVKPAGSGLVEKQVDRVVARRFKKRTKNGYRANPFLKLRLLKLNGQWKQYWRERQRDAAKYSWPAP